MKTEQEIKELWKVHHNMYQDAKKFGLKRGDTAAEICKVLEYILS